MSALHQRTVARPTTAVALLALLAASASLAEPGRRARPRSRAAPRLEMVVQSGHAGEVSEVVFSPDGTLIASCSADYTVKLWSLDGRLLRTLAHRTGVPAVVFRPDGQTLLSGASDGMVREWSTQGALVHAFQAHDKPVTSLALSPDGTVLATGSMDGTARLWRTDGTPLHTLNQKEGFYVQVHRVRFTPDGTRLVLGAHNLYGRRTLSLQVFDVKTGERRANVEGKDASTNINDLAMGPDGQTVLAVAGTVVGAIHDRSVKLWRLDGTLVKAFGEHEARVEAAAVHPAGTAFATGAADGTIKLWAPDGSLRKTFQANRVGVTSLAYSPDGRHLVSASSSFFGEASAIRLWSADGEPVRGFRDHLGGVRDIAFQPGGELVAAAMGYPGNAVKLWSPTGRLVRTLPGGAADVQAVAFNPQGTVLAAAGRNGEIRLFSPEGKRLKTLAHPRVVFDVAFSPDGRLLASASMDKCIKLWTRDGEPVRTLTGHEDNVYSVAFSPDGTRLASGSEDDTIRLWTVEGEPLQHFKAHEEGVSHVVFSPDGRRLASVGQDRKVKIWTLEGKLLHSFDGHSVGYRPDGQRLAVATGYPDPEVQFYDARSFKRISRHPVEAGHLTFSADGQILASGLVEGTLRLWNLRTGKAGTLLSEGDEWLMFTPDGLFDASRQGSELVAMVRGLQVFGVDQFALRNNRPDLILQRLGTADEERIAHYRRQFQRRLRKSGFTEAQLSDELHVPEVTITRAAPAADDPKSLEIAFRAGDSQVPLQSCNVFANGVPLLGAYGAPVTGREHQGARRVTLTAGDNRIEVSCLNQRGAESYRAMTFARYDGPAPGALYLLALGVSRYRDAALDLQFAHQDALDLQAAFARMQGQPFRAVHSKVLLDERVTTTAIAEARGFLAQAGVDDTAVLFIAGHGLHGDDAEATYYFLTHDADLKDLPGTAAAFDQIEALLHGIAPRRKLFLMDTCESGDLDEQGGQQLLALAASRGFRARAVRGLILGRRQPGTTQPSRLYLHERDRYIYHDLVRRSGAVVFSSSRGGELSYESEALKNGFFSEAILDALAHGDADGDGQISVKELREHVARAVSARSQGLQNPTVDRDNPLQRFGFPVLR